MKKMLLLWLTLLPALAFADTPPPGVWRATEVFGGPIRSNWTFLPGQGLFQARWQNGNTAVLRLDHFDGEKILVSRSDTSGPTAGLRVHYEGRRSPDGYRGSVTWYWQGQPQRGQWWLVLPDEVTPAATQP